MEGRVLARGRARWFFAGHMVVTAASLLLLLALGALDVNVEDRPAWVLLGVMLALYVPAGWITARWQGWSRPTPGEGVRAVLLPALTAWAWALTGWGLVTLTPQSGVWMWMLLSTGLFATPSFFLMLLTLFQLATEPLWQPVWYLAMGLAGLLPPLLFVLGSILPKRRLTTAENVIN